MARINQNQFRKIYPGIRRVAKTIALSEIDVVLEAAVVDFAGEDAVVYAFQQRYIKEPSVTATPAGANSNVNIYISSISTTSVTINTSAAMSGLTAHIVVVEVP